MSMARLDNAQRAMIARQLADSDARLKYGVVDGYDPDTHSARVNIMPEEILTGWLPIMVQWVGDQFGLYIGLGIGDQVMVLHVEGDRNVGIIIGRLNSDTEKPPSVPTGEAWMVHKTGSFLKFLTDGNVELTTNKDLVAQVAGKLTAEVQDDAEITVHGDVTGQVDGDTNITCDGQLVVHCDDINLGGTGGKKIGLDGDSTAGGTLHASSTKVKAI